jgi:cation:H+ antiporter
MMSASVMVWLEFGICVALIGVAGTRLSRYGDIIAEKTGMGGTWIGLILLASVTSLPELVSSCSIFSTAASRFTPVQARATYYPLHLALSCLDWWDSA